MRSHTAPEVSEPGLSLEPSPDVLPACPAPGAAQPWRHLASWSWPVHSQGPGRAFLSQRLLLGPCSGVSPKIAQGGVAGQLRPAIRGQRPGSARAGAGWLAGPSPPPGPGPAPLQRLRPPALGVAHVTLRLRPEPPSRQPQLLESTLPPPGLTLPGPLQVQLRLAGAVL